MTSVTMVDHDVASFEAGLDLTHLSGTKKEPKPKLLSPDIFW